MRSGWGDQCRRTSTLWTKEPRSHLDQESPGLKYLKTFMLINIYIKCRTWISWITTHTLCVWPSCCWFTVYCRLWRALRCCCSVCLTFLKLLNKTWIKTDHLSEDTLWVLMTCVHFLVKGGDREGKRHIKEPEQWGVCCVIRADERVSTWDIRVKNVTSDRTRCYSLCF